MAQFIEFRKWMNKEKNALYTIVKYRAKRERVSDRELCASAKVLELLENRAQSCVDASSAVFITSSRKAFCVCAVPWKAQLKHHCSLSPALCMWNALQKKWVRWACMSSAFYAALLRLFHNKNFCCFVEASQGLFLLRLHSTMHRRSGLRHFLTYFLWSLCKFITHSFRVFFFSLCPTKWLHIFMCAKID